MNDITRPNDYSERANRETISQALSLLVSLPRREVDIETGKLNLEAYHIALKGVTRRGLAEAIKAILRGELGHGFMPSPPELRRQYETAMEPVYRQMQAAKARDRKPSKPAVDYSPDAKARIAAIYAGFCASHQSKQAVSEPDAFRIEPDDPRLASIPDAKTGWRKAGQR